MLQLQCGGGNDAYTGVEATGVGSYDGGIVHFSGVCDPCSFMNTGERQAAYSERQLRESVLIVIYSNKKFA